MYDVICDVINYRSWSCVMGTVINEIENKIVIENAKNRDLRKFYMNCI